MLFLWLTIKYCMTNPYVYLPELHDFEHIALAPWPQYDSQLDWVENISTLEEWLQTRIGPHWDRWAWATCQEHHTWEACVAFKMAQHKTLFLLTWT